MENQKSLIKIIIGVLAFVIVAVALIFGVKTVQTGEVLVVKQFGKQVAVKEAGLHFINPIGRKLTRFTIAQDNIAEEYSVSTSDMQTVLTRVVIHFSINPEYVFDIDKKFGGMYVDGIIRPSIAEAVNTATSKYTIEELVEKRIQLSDDMLKMARERLDGYGINVIAVDITDHDFSDSYEAAVESKKVAQQMTEQKREEVKQAELAAERNRIMADSYTKENYIREFLDKWDGKLPVVVGDDDVLVNILNGDLATEIHQG